jgi:hypothetical protein
LKEDGGKDSISDQSSFEKIKIESLGLFIFTKLTTQSLCSVSVVKRRYMLLPIFGFPHKNLKNTKKIIGARKGCWKTEKGQNWLKRFKNAKG